MTIFIILLLSFVGALWWKYNKEEQKDKIKRLRKFNKEQKIYAEEYTSGKYDFITYKHHISELRSKYRV